MNQELLEKVQQFAEGIIAKEFPPGLKFHNLDHARRVARHAQIFGADSDLSDDDMEILLVAAWLQDLGLRRSYEDHESGSAVIAKEFLTSEGIEEEKVHAVLNTIEATKPQSQPTSTLQRVLLDANHYFLARDDFPQRSELLRKEYEHFQNEVYTDMRWLERERDILIGAEFHSSAGKNRLEKGKEEQRKKLKKRIKKLRKEIDEGLEKELGVTEEELKALKKKLMKVEGRPERGIETMFRITSKNHLTLSGLADTKANIMISVNSIIISILIVALMQRFATNPELMIPTFILFLVNLGAIIFAILATRPNVSKGTFTRSDIEEHNINLLFFGNFHKMKREDYQWGMTELMESSNYLYASLIDDIYFLGVVLGKKYKYLRYSYNIFMYGIVIAVLSFVVSSLLYN